LFEKEGGMSETPDPLPDDAYTLSEYDVVQALAVFARAWSPEAMLFGNFSAQTIWTACEQVIENARRGEAGK
jgi:hypothetical protein